MTREQLRNLAEALARNAAPQELWFMLSDLKKGKQIMDIKKIATCKGCGQKIRWIITAAGKQMPVDPEPLAWDDVEEGTLLIDQEGNVKRSDGNLFDDDGRAWFVTHFATCPKADDFRQPKKTIGH